MVTDCGSGIWDDHGRNTGVRATRAAGFHFRPHADPVFFGRISYSFYLLHPLTLLIIWKVPSALGAVIAVGVPAVLVAAFLIFASIVLLTPLAFAMYRWIEIPGIAAGRRFGDCLSKLGGRLGRPAANPFPA